MTNATFNFIPAARRLKQLFASKRFEYQVRKGVPSINSMTYKDAHYADCYVVCVDIRGSSTLHTKYANDDVLVKIYQGFISELVRVMNACPYIAHVDIHGDSVTGIFHAKRLGVSASLIYEWAIRATEVVAILNKQLTEIGLEPIRVGVGLSHGRVLMVKAGAKGNESEVVWLGEPVNFASKLSSLANKEPANGDGQFMATQAFYAGLNSNYQNSFGASRHSGFYTSITEYTTNDYARYEKEWPLLEKKPSTSPLDYAASRHNFSSVPSALASLGPYTPPMTPTGSSIQRMLAAALQKDITPSTSILASFFLPLDKK